MKNATKLKLGKLTEQTLRNLPVPETGELTYTATYTKGLTIRIRNSGTKVFYARLWNPRTKAVLRRKLGEWPDMSCALAVKALEKLKRQQEENKWIEEEIHYTLAQAFDYYQAKKVSEEKSASFLQQIDQAWRCVPMDLRATLLDQIPLHQLSDLVAKIAMERKGTAFHLRRLLKAIYKVSLINEWCTKDRTLTIEPIPISPRRLLVDNEQIAKVLDVARQHKDQHKVCALLLCAATGQRGSEIMGLCWENIQEDSIIFPAEIRKQRTEHIVWLNDLAREALSYLPRGKGPIFPMAHRNWLSDFGKVQGRKAKVKGFGVHQLRKAVISNLLTQGLPVHVVQQVSGHKDASILMKHYAISTESQAKDAAQKITFKAS
ncbi:tyrosine-type recombinase/integrase [Ruegeria conchae]|uniref:tyrosine-type recombinase/integrase n=1 Tax=Ruegeria conchae TaxID=981384 RepID=UPI0029C7B7F0|nr:tyrosine-type recombinase/integrase [Ruegeria conchae]